MSIASLTGGTVIFGAIHGGTLGGRWKMVDVPGHGFLEGVVQRGAFANSIASRLFFLEHCTQSQ